MLEQTAEAQMQRTGTKGAAVRVPSSQVFVKMPKEVRERSRSREALQAGNRSQKGTLKEVNSRVFVRMPKYVRRRRSLSRESRSNGVRQLQERNDMPCATRNDMSVAAAKSTTEENAATPVQLHAEQEPYADDLTLQSAGEKRSHHKSLSESSPATVWATEADTVDKTDNAEGLACSVSKPTMQAEADSAVLAEEAKSNEEFKAEATSPTQKSNSPISMVENENRTTEKPRCCTVM
ncbi:hypothetical protein Q4I32_006410 [Leishmania shawi]|uniref:Uncharacterized protein n=1 Tax=Leishmania shawi TaxID=5680 RepID=A0AAW3BGV9_9TRYP